MPVMTHLRYRKYADLMLVGNQVGRDSDHTREETPRDHGVAIYVTAAAESVDAVAERAETFGAEISEGPHETSWNTREVTLVDPNGYEVVFSEQAETDVAFKDVMGTSSRDE